MAPPRLPQVYVDRLAGILAGYPLLLTGSGGCTLSSARSMLDAWVAGVETNAGPRRFAAELLGSAANLVPAYDGPRRGWTALGELVAVLLADPSTGAADSDWLAALIVRYRLIPWAVPGADVPAPLRARLAALSPQPPPYWDSGGMLSPALAHAWQYDALAAAAAAADWPQVRDRVAAIVTELQVPEQAALIRAELAERGLDVAELAARAGGPGVGPRSGEALPRPR